MPKIKVELEVPEEYCDEPYNICPMCVDDGVASYCVAFNYALEEEDFHCKRLKICKQAEVTEEPKILLVEDGSIDFDDLAMFIDEHDLKIKIVVYRQGSTPPRFLKQSED